jgi:cobalamin biosynthetic protein CobC
LKSLGKFFGLAGARVGFLLAPEEILAPAYQHLGPWPIAGPSAFVAGAALADRDWQVETRRRLTADRDRLALAVQDGLGIPVGGTDLFLHLQHHRAPQFFDALLDRAIYVRRFEHDLTRLRIGLPQPGPAFERTTAALDVLSKI